ncbi:hypothetical protein EJ06DRAFT_143463 [Trichodelitschia bisporula]|uniref:Uncharacterized protein n=1 Tax=Trichodelitschia bisporula TaxID=703511 RepID=A0A6G1HPE5_9PEZI|nr:hypothetical protein EJ06DRAFT_143463 [Trichodelitschia bisporula]
MLGHVLVPGSTPYSFGSWLPRPDKRMFGSYFNYPKQDYRRNPDPGRGPKPTRQDSPEDRHDHLAETAQYPCDDSMLSDAFSIDGYGNVQEITSGWDEAVVMATLLEPTTSGVAGPLAVPAIVMPVQTGRRMDGWTLRL